MKRYCVSYRNKNIIYSRFYITFILKKCSTGKHLNCTTQSVDQKYNAAVSSIAKLPYKDSRTSTAYTEKKMNTYRKHFVLKQMTTPESAKKQTRVEVSIQNNNPGTILTKEKEDQEYTQDERITTPIGVDLRKLVWIYIKELVDP